MTVARYKANGQLDSTFTGQGFLSSPLMGRSTAIAFTENGGIAPGGRPIPMEVMDHKNPLAILPLPF